MATPPPRGKKRQETEKERHRESEKRDTERQGIRTETEGDTERQKHTQRETYHSPQKTHSRDFAGGLV